MSTNRRPSPEELRVLQQQSRERRALSSAKTQQRETEAYAKMAAAAQEQYTKMMTAAAAVTQGEIIDLAAGARLWIAPHQNYYGHHDLWCSQVIDRMGDVFLQAHGRSMTVGGLSNYSAVVFIVDDEKSNVIIACATMGLLSDGSVECRNESGCRYQGAKLLEAVYEAAPLLLLSKHP